MTKEIITKEQIKNELDRGRRESVPMLVGCLLISLIAVGVGIALTVGFAGTYKEYQENILHTLIFYAGVAMFAIIALLGLYGTYVMGSGIYEILFGSWRSQEIVITRDEVSRMVDEETVRRRSARGSYTSYDSNVLYFYRCGRYLTNSTVYGYTSVGDEFYVVSYSGETNRPCRVYSTKIYEIKE